MLPDGWCCEREAESIEEDHPTQPGMLRRTSQKGLMSLSHGFLKERWARAFLADGIVGAKMVEARKSMTCLRTVHS